MQTATAGIRFPVCITPYYTILINKATDIANTIFNKFQSKTERKKD